MTAPTFKTLRLCTSQSYPVMLNTKSTTVECVDLELTVAQAGEQAVLDTVLQQLKPASSVDLGPGDDSAVIRHEGRTVVSSDTMIEGPDFRLDWHTPRELGWKLAAVNLSDIAAMGAHPTALTVSLACPKDTRVSVLRDIAAGIQDALDTLAPECAVAGGDLATAPMLLGAVTALGDLAGQAPVLRSGAAPGDTLAYGGDLGLSGLGLTLLARGGRNEAAQLPAAMSAHLTPDPPLHLGIHAARAGASAMMDVSDGLSLDAQRLARASQISIDIYGELLDQSFGSQRGWRRQLEPVDVSRTHMLTGGEDHGMLASFPPGVTLPEGFHAIGRVNAQRESLIYVDGEPFAASGWDPFATV